MAWILRFFYLQIFEGNYAAFFKKLFTKKLFCNKALIVKKLKFIGDENKWINQENVWNLSLVEVYIFLYIIFNWNKNLKRIHKIQEYFLFEWIG